MDDKKYANTVRELIAMLLELSDSTPVCGWRGDARDVDGPVFHVTLDVDHENGAVLVRGTEQGCNCQWATGLACQHAYHNGRFCLDCRQPLPSLAHPE